VNRIDQERKRPIAMRQPSTILHALCGITSAALLSTPIFAGALPVNGRPTPGLSQFDSAMQAFMETNGMEAAVMGVMRNGRIVYLKGFGYDYDDNNLPENTPFRLASCSKPLTVAAVRQRIAAGDFAVGDHAFNLGQPGGGLLNYTPFPSLGDNRLKNITIQHLISHQGGWDRGIVGDLTYMETDIADDMNVDSPPGRVNTVRWILGQPLQFTPGTDTAYSNIGCLCMGLIVEQETGQSLINYVRGHVLTPDMWVPSTEIFQARTFRDWQNPREPHYAGEGIVSNIFDNYGGPLVYKPYGGFDVEARMGQGGYCCSAATMLKSLQTYHCGAYDSDLGKPINATDPLDSAEAHNGSQAGVSTYMVQRTDGINVFIAFNENDHDDGEHYPTDFYNNSIKPLLDAGNLSWPNSDCDGAWVLTGGLLSGGLGGYNRPYLSFSYAMSEVADGTKVRLKAGASTFTGTINKQLLLDAPLGVATIGQ